MRQIHQVAIAVGTVDHGCGFRGGSSRGTRIPLFENGRQHFSDAKFVIVVIFKDYTALVLAHNKIVTFFLVFGHAVDVFVYGVLCEELVDSDGLCLSETVHTGLGLSVHFGIPINIVEDTNLFLAQQRKLTTIPS